VADVDDGSLAGSVKKAAAIGTGNPATFPANGNGIVFAKISRKNAGVARHGAWDEIVTE
jgi:hypothetical protein